MFIHSDPIIVPRDKCVTVSVVIDCHADNAKLRRQHILPVQNLSSEADGVDAILE
jgi:hypothetical protein